MQCLWKDITEPDVKGFRRVQCTRQGCGIIANSPRPHERIRSECRAWPMRYELGHWLALILSALWMPKTRWQWLRYRLGFIEPCGCNAREQWLNTLGGRCIAFARRFIPVQALAG